MCSEQVPVNQPRESSRATTIRTPDDPALDALCRQLASAADELDLSGDWPRRQLELCGQYGVYRWFVPASHGGFEWSDADVYRGYFRLASACLTTTFIITQRTGACRRLVTSPNRELQRRLLPPLVEGAAFATVGISHLTTSRRHLGQPAMRATKTAGGYVLDGFSPWVTGGPHAQVVVVGVTLDDGREMLVALPTDARGVTTNEPARLVALTASHTGAVRCEAVFVESDAVVDGPRENIMVQGGASTGGLQTSALALGLAQAAVDFLSDEADRRGDLASPASRLQEDCVAQTQELVALAEGRSSASTEQFRATANGLALRASQAALAAAKGSGYLAGHPAGRWCREALFFLVWSCPQGVVDAHLCELAGLAD